MNKLTDQVGSTMKPIITLGSLLVECRKKYNLNQTEFAEMGGVSYSSQSLYEADKRIPHLEYFKKLQLHGIDALAVVEQYLNLATLDASNL